MNLWGSKYLHNNQTFSPLNFNCQVRLLDINSNKIQDLESACSYRKKMQTYLQVKIVPISNKMSFFHLIKYILIQFDCSTV